MTKHASVKNGLLVKTHTEKRILDRDTVRYTVYVHGVCAIFSQLYSSPPEHLVLLSCVLNHKLQRLRSFPTTQCSPAIIPAPP